MYQFHDFLQHHPQVRDGGLVDSCSFAAAAPLDYFGIIHFPFHIPPTIQLFKSVSFRLVPTQTEAR